MNSQVRVTYTSCIIIDSHKLSSTYVRSSFIVTPHAQRERSTVVSIYIYVCSRKKYLNRTLEIDSPFQTLTVGLLVEFID